MPRSLTPEQLAKRNAENAKPLQEVYEAAVKKGLTSSSASERTQALAQAGAMLTPTLGELRAKIKELEDASAAAETALKESQTALDAANAELVPLREQAAKVVPLESELTDLRTNFDARVADMRKELVADAQQERFKAERTLRSAEEKLREADNKIAASGWKELRVTLADLIARHSVPMPSFWETSTTMPSAFWELWGWSPAKARVYTAYKSSFKEPTESFKQQAFRILTANLPSWGVVSPNQSDDEPLRFEYAHQSAEIPDLGVRRECLIEMAQRFGCLREIQQRVAQREAEILGQHLRENAASLQAQQISMTQQGGYGREAINVQPEQSSATGCPPGEPHLLGCVCNTCTGGTRRRTSLDVIEETF
jgi:hypothetical protein